MDEFGSTPKQPDRKQINRRRRTIIFFLLIGLIFVALVTVFVLYQTQDAWRPVSSLQTRDAATAEACETFIQEFPGTPCPPFNGP